MYLQMIVRKAVSHSHYHLHFDRRFNIFARESDSNFLSLLFHGRFTIAGLNIQRNEIISNYIATLGRYDRRKPDPLVSISFLIGTKASGARPLPAR